MWIARVVDTKEISPTEFVGPMTQAQADKFFEKHDGTNPRFEIYLEMLCLPSQFTLITNP